MEPRTAPTVADIIALWPSTETFAEDLRLKRGTDHARVMKVRRRIPKHHWDRLLSRAQARGIPITERDLEAANSSRSL